MSQIMIRFQTLRRCFSPSSGSAPAGLIKNIASSLQHQRCLQQLHRFQSSATSTRRIRRRRDGLEPTTTSDTPTSSSSSSSSKNPQQTDNETNLPIMETDKIKMMRNKPQFQKLTHSFLSKCQKALEPMKAHNEVFTITRSSNDQGEVLTIGLAPSEGQYVLQVDEDVFTLSLRSPISGNYTYVLSENTHEFVGMEDGHNLEGMIVRDLIRHCNGLPKF